MTIPGTTKLLEFVWSISFGQLLHTVTLVGTVFSFIFLSGQWVSTVEKQQEVFASKLTEIAQYQIRQDEVEQRNETSINQLATQEASVAQSLVDVTTQLNSTNAIIDSLLVNTPLTLKRK